MQKEIVVEWESGKPCGKIEVTYGKLKKIRILKGKGTVSERQFRCNSQGSFRLKVTVDGANVNAGSGATRITLNTGENPFSFFLRDVDKKYPVYIPEYHVAVTEKDDRRSYRQVERDIKKRKLSNTLQHIQNEPEETYEESASHTRKLTCPTWLGLSRNFRIFEVGFQEGSERWHTISPLFAGEPAVLPETGKEKIQYNFMFGRGLGCTNHLSRRLEQGILPILHAEDTDNNVTYRVTAFAGLRKNELTQKNLRGTHFLVADGYGNCHSFTPSQQKEFDSLVKNEMKNEEVVLYCRIHAVNTASTPRYAWLKNPFPSGGAYSFDGKNGFGVFDSGRIFSISKLNGKPLAQEEIAVLLRPGESSVLDVFLPHQPVSIKKAAQLTKQDFEIRRKECGTFWTRKLKSAGRMDIPEQRINEMVQAGLLHLDISSYGLEPDGAIAPAVGKYSAIGTESAPVIQFMDSMGRHRIAGRMITHFFEKQHEDGYMQNFDGYMGETGAVLWTAGEHYRYTRDQSWAREVAPKLLKSCEYILNWRERNRKETFKGKGYGMLDGKIADPDDFYHQFVLNGYACAGLARTAEMLAEFDMENARRLWKAADNFKKNIRTAFFEATAKSPVVPLGDGTWCPTAPAWTEACGPLFLSAEKGNWYTHGSFMIRDMLGPLYLIFHEIIRPDEQSADHLINLCAELMCRRNVQFSQPYYSCHPWAHLKRGEIKAFLKAYYNGFAGLADRETYTFWEHYAHYSPHKTHEEAWFLMQTRWMLYMEHGQTLKLLPGIPRKWLENGKCIGISEMASYFGPVSLTVTSELNKNLIRVDFECTARPPESVEIRIPHPEGKRARRVTGGIYNYAGETVKIKPFNGKAAATLRF